MWQSPVRQSVFNVLKKFDHGWTRLAGPTRTHSWRTGTSTQHGWRRKKKAPPSHAKKALHAFTTCSHLSRFSRTVRTSTKNSHPAMSPNFPCFTSRKVTNGLQTSPVDFEYWPPWWWYNTDPGISSSAMNFIEMLPTNEIKKWHITTTSSICGMAGFCTTVRGGVGVLLASITLFQFACVKVLN